MGDRPSPTHRLVRPELDDLEAILAIINDPLSPHRQVECLHRDSPEQASELYDRLSEDDNLALALDGHLVGYASWQLFDRHAHLNILSIAGGHQRQGLGQALFEGFRAQLREDGVVSYTLRAFADSEWALRFYAGMGLTPIPPWEAIAPSHEGLARYITLATSHGQWPLADKVIFFEALG